MRAVECAWVGAFIDAEGSVGLAKPWKDAWQIALQITEPEYVSTLLRFTGVGNVSYSNPRGISKLPQYRWSVTAKLDIETLLRQLAPYSLKAQGYINGE
jgi:hypothetical protein